MQLKFTISIFTSVLYVCRKVGYNIYPTLFIELYNNTVYILWWYKIAPGTKCWIGPHSFFHFPSMSLTTRPLKRKACFSHLSDSVQPWALCNVCSSLSEAFNEVDLWLLQLSKNADTRQGVNFHLSLLAYKQTHPRTQSSRWKVNGCWWCHTNCACEQTLSNTVQSQRNELRIFNKNE